MTQGKLTLTPVDNVGTVVGVSYEDVAHEGNAPAQGIIVIDMPHVEVVEHFVNWLEQLEPKEFYKMIRHLIRYTDIVLTRMGVDEDGRIE